MKENIKNAFLKVGEPCRNFNVLNYTAIMDPKDGREKIVLSNYAAGSVGNLVFIDSLTGEGERIPLPGDGGAWGLLNLGNDKLLVGTCPNYAYLLCLDLRTRTWAEPLVSPGETYIWNLVLGSDGMVYGCTYPGCALLRYDPKEHSLKKVGRVSDNPKNMYAKFLHSEAKGFIIVSGGFDEKFLKAWSMESECFIEFGQQDTLIKQITDEFICTQAENGILAFYSPRTLQPIYDESLIAKVASAPEIELDGGKRIRAIPLQNGRMVGVKGQEYCIADQRYSIPELKRIPTEAPETRIHTLTSDSNGVIWGSCEFGQTIFRYNPRDGVYWNSPAVCDEGGEVYGMVFVEERLFMTSYIGGDHIVYDPGQSWDQLHNVNPRTLRPVGPELVRPESRSVLGPDGNIWTGWAAKYGTYGGGISCIDVDTLEVKSWYDPIPGQQVTNIAADDKYVYFTTNSGGNGLENKGEPCHLVIWSPDGSIVRQFAFAPGVTTGALMIFDGRILIGVGDEIRIYSSDFSTFTRVAHTGKRSTCMLAIDHEKSIVFCEDRFFLVNIQLGTVEHTNELPGLVGTATMTKDGEIYFACETKLYKLYPV